MTYWFRQHRVFGLVLAALIAFICSIAFLAGSAPRDWSLHWVQPMTVLPAVAGGSDDAAAPSPAGTDLLWLAPGNRMTVSHFNGRLQRVGRSVSFRGAPVSLTLARSGSVDVAAWQEDLSSSSRLMGAIVRADGTSRTVVLARGPWALEHPNAFSTPTGVDVVFSWQRHGVYNVFLSRVGRDGTVKPPVQITHVSQYAFLPRGVAASDGTFHLLYLNLCCSGDGFHVTHARYTAAGRPLSSSVLDSVTTATQTSNGTPDTWGIDLQRDGNQIWGAWTSDQNVDIAVWQGARTVVPPHGAVPLIHPDTLTLALAGGHRSLLWPQQTEQDTFLATLPLNAQGVPAGEPDRVAYEATFDESPQAIVMNGLPAVIWQAQVSHSNTTALEASHYTPKTLGAPSVWAQLGLGLANPIGNLLLLVVGALAIGGGIAIGNIIIVLALSVLYFVINRFAPAALKWYLYALVLSGAIYLLVVHLGAPSPPLLFFSSLSGHLALFAVVGMAVFVLLITLTVLQRVDDFFRAVVMAFAAFYFIAFLEALTIVQGQIGKI